MSGGTFGRYVQQKLSAEDIWKEKFGVIKESLRSGKAICERYVQVCSTLVTQFWKRYGANSWKGKEYVPETLIELGNRLDEVIQ